MNGTNPEALAGQIAQLEATIKLRERVARLEARLEAGPGHGSPAAIPPHQPRYIIAPHPGGPSAMDRLRVEFASKGQYEKM